MPSLSDDYHRYVWDGRVQLAGVNPYKYRPYEHALDRVRYSGRDLINHEELKTVYPPLTQAVFLGVAEASRALGLEDAVTPRAEVVLFKLVFGAFDLATAAAVWFLADAQAAAAGDGALPALPGGDRADVGVGARRGGGDVLLRARRRPARAPPRRLGRASRSGSRRRSRSRRSRCSYRRCWAGGPRPPASSPASSRPSSSPTSRTSSPAAPSARCSRAAPTGSGGSLIFTLLVRLTTAEIARWLVLALFVGGALWIAGSFRGREKTAEAFAWTLTLLDLLPARRPRLVLADAARAGTGRRSLAAAADRDGRTAGRVAAARRQGGGAASRRERAGRGPGLLAKRRPHAIAVLWLRDAVGILRR